MADGESTKCSRRAHAHFKDTLDRFLSETDGHFEVIVSARFDARVVGGRCRTCNEELLLAVDRDAALPELPRR